MPKCIKHTCKDCIHFKICNDYVYLIGREDKVACSDYKSTEDVVPRSEYDAVVSAVDNSTKEFLKLHDAYQNQKRDFEAELNKAKQEVAMEILGEIDFVFKTIKMEIDTHIGEAIVENEMSTANAIQYGKDVVCVAEKALLMALKKNIGEKK